MEHNGMETNGVQHVAEERAKEMERAVEALVFAADEPLTGEQIAEVWATVANEEVDLHEIEEAVERLNVAYEREGRALRIRHWAGGYRLSTVEAVAPYLKSFFQRDRRRRLSRSLMETLAILAYRQPATKPEIDFVRGVDSDYALRRLMEIGLVDVIGRSEAVGRPMLYGTTPRFLEEFGLAGLKDLPNLREIEDLLGDPAFNKERAKLLMLKGLGEETPSSEETSDDS